MMECYDILFLNLPLFLHHEKEETTRHKKEELGINVSLRFYLKV
jgi:hypothetical protein